MVSKDLHESMERLLSAARLSTGIKDLDFAVVAAKLGASSATVSNWKTRGVSMDAAVEAEGLYGCSAYWVIHGKQPAALPPPNPDLKARPATTPSGWALLDAIDALPSELRSQRIAEILAEGEKWEAIASELVRRAKKDKGGS